MWKLSSLLFVVALPVFAGMFGSGTTDNFKSFTYGQTSVKRVTRHPYTIWEEVVAETLYALEFNGSTDYVDTGVYMEANVPMEMRMFYHLVSYSTSVNAVHGFSSGTNPRFFFGIIQSSNQTNMWSGYNNVATIASASTGAYDKWRAALVNNTTYIENDTTISTFNALTTTASTGVYTIHVGCRMFNGSPSARFPVIVHRWQILKNGVVVQDCKANSAGTFTDSVSGTNIVGKAGAMTSTVITTNYPTLWQ